MLGKLAVNGFLIAEPAGNGMQGSGKAKQARQKPNQEYIYAYGKETSLTLI